MMPFPGRSGRHPAILLAIPLLAALLLTPLGCARNEPAFNSRFLAFGTLMDLSIIGVPYERAQEATATLEQDFQQMHKLWHAWDPGPLGRVNQLLASGETFSAPPSVLPLVVIGQQLSERSDNLFDPAVGKLVGLWGFHADMPAIHEPPSEEEILALVEQNPRMSDIHIDGYHMRSDNPSVQLDFGAFGKGYGIDRAVERLREMGINNAIVNAGGDLRAIGSRAGHPWRIAIRGASGTGVLGVVEVKGDESVFTSGNYERNFTWQGKLYHHIIDPRTGYPAEGTRSVTVIHDNATVADAAATALFVAGPKDWHRIARQMGIGYVLLVDTEGTLHMNPAMQKRLQLLDGTKHPVEISAPLDAASATGPATNGQ